MENSVLLKNYINENFPEYKDWRVRIITTEFDYFSGTFDEILDKIEHSNFSYEEAEQTLKPMFIEMQVPKGFALIALRSGQQPNETDSHVMLMVPKSLIHP